VIASDLGKKVDAIRKCVQRMVSSGHLVMAERGLYDLPPISKTPVLGVLDVSDVPGVLGVLGDSGQEWDRVGQEECPNLTNGEQTENVRIGQVGQGGHRFTSDPLHDIDQDAIGVLSADSGDYVPRRADSPPKAADVDTPLGEMAKASRKKAGARHSNLCMFGNWTATRSPVDHEQPPGAKASADSMGEQVDDTEEEVF
jgi:hypothetical protein